MKRHHDDANELEVFTCESQAEFVELLTSLELDDEEIAEILRETGDLQ